jgi:myo-inositol-1(or 4)-monophosphatase
MRGGRARVARVFAMSGAAPKMDARDLKKIAEAAAQAGAAVIADALSRPRVAQSKGAIGDIVTESDRAAEAAIVEVVRAAAPGHAVLGEEGGVIAGDVGSEYLW